MSVRTFSDDERLRIVRRAEQIGVRPAAVEAGCSPSLVTRWAQRAGLKPPPKVRKPVLIHPDLMDRAMRIARGKTVAEAARVTGVSRSRIERRLRRDPIDRLLKAIDPER